MPKRRDNSHLFTVKRSDLDRLARRDPHGLFDMLRYDAATIVAVHTEVIVLRTTNGTLPVRPRWTSFGCSVIEFEPYDEGDTGADIIRRSLATLDRQATPVSSDPARPLGR